MSSPAAILTSISDYDWQESETPESKYIIDKWVENILHLYETPISREDHLIERRFHELVETWRQEKGHFSLVQQIAMLPSYQRIIGLGKDAIPLLLRELERKPDHWFWALEALTGINPVPEQDRGKLRKMTEAWINWGRENNYL